MILNQHLSEAVQCQVRQIWAWYFQRPKYIKCLVRRHLSLLLNVASLQAELILLVTIQLHFNGNISVSLQLYKNLYFANFFMDYTIS